MNRIRILREGRKLRQDDISKLLGINVPSVSKYESGDTDIPQSKLEILANFFEVSIDYLVCHNSKKSIKEDYHVSAEEYNLIKKYRLLDERGKESVDDTIDREYKHSIPNIKEQEAM